MSFEEICRRTIPQIEAILERLGKHISLKIGVPSGEGESIAEPAEEHSTDEALAFIAQFNR